MKLIIYKEIFLKYHHNVNLCACYNFWKCSYNVSLYAYYNFDSKAPITLVYMHIILFSNAAITWIYMHIIYIYIFSINDAELCSLQCTHMQCNWHCINLVKTAIYVKLVFFRKAKYTKKWRSIRRNGDICELHIQ